MGFLHVVNFLAVINAYGYLCLGIPGDKGLIIGMWNPASVFTVTEIPASPANYYNNASFQLYPSSIQITSIASDARKNVLFLNIGFSIYRFQNFSIWQNTSAFSEVYKGRSLSIGEIAFDYVSNNLYWCDLMMKWIAMIPAYMDNPMVTIVVDNNLRHPQGIALDPEDGLMFFSDNEPKSRIEKASMDGTNRSVIVHTGLLWVPALSVDAANDVLYWADYMRNTLEVSNYDGSKRRVLRRRNNMRFTGLHYYQNILHAVSDYSRRFIGVDTISGLELYSVKLTEGQPHAVHVYDAEVTKIYTDPCTTQKCQHMCVNTPSGATCLCAEGYILSSDAMTCTDRTGFFEKGFIVSNKTVLSMVDVHSVNERGRAVKHLKIPEANIATLAVDANLHIIYFVDSSNNTLKEFNLNTHTPRILAPVSNARDLIFDWIANLLGWIDYSQSNIQVFSLISGAISTVYFGLEQPVSLTIDANNGYLFWISGISTKSILRGSWNGKAHRSIVSSDRLNNPLSLHYDVTSHRIYWLDSSLIISSTVNGSDIKTHNIITFGATVAIAYKDFFVWTLGSSIHFARNVKSASETSLDIIPNTTDLIVFDSSLQQDHGGSCHFFNGGCEDICIPIQNGRKCQCDFGLKLQNDSTCDNDIYTTNFIIVADYSHGRILQIDLNTGNVTKLPIIEQRVSSIKLDKSTMEVYFSDTTTNTIMSTTLHGKNKTLVYSTGYAYIERMVIDYSTGNIYYTAIGTSTTQNYIGVVEKFNALHKTLLSKLQNIRGIALYPSKGVMYWTEFGNMSQIGRSFMDGTSKFYVITADLVWPSGLAIDFETNRLYWTDGYTNRIEYSDLNGGNRRLLTTDADAHLNDIVISGQNLFYTAWNRHRIIKLDKTSGSKITFMSEHPELGRLDSSDIFNSADDPVDVNHICSKTNGQCSTFCFPTPNGRTCGCQDGVNLQSDQKTCEGVTLCPSSIDDAELSSSCSRRVGEFCEIICLEANTSHSIVCTSQGTWRQDTRTLCYKEIVNVEKAWLTVVYIGSSVGGFIIIVTLVTAVICFIKRRKPPINNYNLPPVDGNNSYLTFRNEGFLPDGLQDKPKSHMSIYSTIEDAHII